MDSEDLLAQARVLIERTRLGTLTGERVGAASMGHCLARSLGVKAVSLGLNQSYRLLKDVEKRAFIGDCCERLSLRYDNFQFNSALGIRPWSCFDGCLSTLQYLSAEEQWTYAWGLDDESAAIVENAGRMLSRLESLMGADCSLEDDSSALKFCELVRWALYFMDENEYNWQKARLSEYLVHGLETFHPHAHLHPLDLSETVMTPWTLQSFSVER
ncbi:MAG: hypothetical protein P1V97_07475 [Planctomycetota bacterium]|nr:hypothetical protein [Planctomycetota bacterium]